MSLQQIHGSTFCPVKVKLLKRGSAGDDVKELQQLLNDAGASPRLSVDGQFGPGTERAVISFQRRRGLIADGLVGSKTICALRNNPSISKDITQEDLVWAAQQLRCSVASIMAVHEVESRGEGFLTDGRPAILYERHIMRRRLNAHGIDPTPYIKKYPNLVNTKTGGYIGGSREHDRLNDARNINDSAALESASWGAYQIMGFHWKALGYSSVQDYVQSMYESERRHLEAFVRFVRLDSRLIKAIQNNDFETFARYYNGPAYAEHGYHTRLAAAYRRSVELLALAA